GSGWMCLPGFLSRMQRIPRFEFVGSDRAHRVTPKAATHTSLGLRPGLSHRGLAASCVRHVKRLRCLALSPREERARPSPRGIELNSESRVDLCRPHRAVRFMGLSHYGLSARIWTRRRRTYGFSLPFANAVAAASGT